MEARVVVWISELASRLEHFCRHNGSVLTPCECVESRHNVAALWKRTAPEDIIVSGNGIDLWAINEEYTQDAPQVRYSQSFRAFLRHTMDTDGKDIHETVKILQSVDQSLHPDRGVCCNPSTCEANPRRIPFGRNLTGSGVTVVLLGFYATRYANFVPQYEEYSSLPQLVDQVILVWNNPDTAPPPLPEYPQVPVTILRVTNSSLNNRFLVGEMVRTAAVLSQDDDHLLYRPYLSCMYEKWSASFSRSIMSPYTRYVDPTAGTYTLHPWRWYNIALTGQAMFHSRFLHSFASDQYTALRKLVDDNTNGEDIAFNAVAQFESGHPPVYVQASIFWWLVGKSRTKIHEGYGLSASMQSTAEWVAKRGSIARNVRLLFPKNPFIDTDRIIYCP